MTDALFSTIELENPRSTRTGYRLHRLEVFNWGTFDRRVWALGLDGETSLLTGDIGSGKSTLVDAITTLLLPANRITYNKAAGAGARERSLRSYVEGHYRSERNEATGTSRPVALRGSHSYSVILGVFANEGYDETVSLAQVFHQPDRTGQPERFYVSANHLLTIERDFSDFGSELKQLRARLRRDGAAIDTTFPEYARRMRRLLGIASEQAMELFHQTVSMKSVGNLGDFVRSHMLKPVDAGSRVSTIVDHFENLTRSHEAVQRATAQLALLDPLVESADKYEAAANRRSEHDSEREALAVFMAELSLGVLDHTIQHAESELEEATRQQGSIDSLRAATDLKRESLQVERLEAGGDQLMRLDTELAAAASLLASRSDKRMRFATLLHEAGLEDVDSEESFYARARSIERAHQHAAAEHDHIREARSPLVLSHGEAKTRSREIDIEINSLVRSRNNLPAELVALRESLSTAVGASDAQLPFAGELVDVREEHAEWRGAAERVLRPFALSLLVPQSLYARVSAWVNQNHLGARLVYLRVPERRVHTVPVVSESVLRLSDTLDIEPGDFAEYLRGELVKRASHSLVDGVAALQREDRAVTREGLVRDRDRHEKDDRYRVTDPRRWVLGRSSERKIEALQSELGQLSELINGLERQLAELDRQDRGLVNVRNALGRLEEYTSWDEIDEEGAAAVVAALQGERERVVAGSSRLEEIDRQLDVLGREIEKLKGEYGVITERLGWIKSERDRLGARRRRDQGVIGSIQHESITTARGFYPVLRARIGAREPTSVEECDELRNTLSGELTRGIESAQREMNGYSTSVQQQMGDVLRQWPELATEMDASIGSIADFRRLYERVKNDDLPRFEAEFKHQLNTEAIKDLAGFNVWLTRQAEEIRDRVATINEALAAIDYNPGRIIVLLAEPTVNSEILQFRSDMRAATGDLLGDDDNAEQRFERVRLLVEKFRGREGHAEHDKLWVSRVTDVRNWYRFAASERERETGDEHEHYTDSDGKSGGQKEKLAYTILAASLAYQFGLEWGVEKSRDFRFVVIDEAFGRGSDQSTRYALTLFEKLGLQLLIVTPLQKVHVIEPYVRSIGFVDNLEGSASRVHTLTVEEFRERRAAHS